VQWLSILTEATLRGTDLSEVNLTLASLNYDSTSHHQSDLVLEANFLASLVRSDYKLLSLRRLLSVDSFGEGCVRRTSNRPENKNPLNMLF
jgi:hypothetical protein